MGLPVPVAYGFRLACRAPDRAVARVIGRLTVRVTGQLSWTRLLSGDAERTSDSPPKARQLSDCSQDQRPLRRDDHHLLTIIALVRAGTCRHWRWSVAGLRAGQTLPGLGMMLMIIQQPRSAGRRCCEAIPARRRCICRCWALAHQVMRLDDKAPGASVAAGRPEAAARARPRGLTRAAEPGPAECHVRGLPLGPRRLGSCSGRARRQRYDQSQVSREAWSAATRARHFVCCPGRLAMWPRAPAQGRCR